MSVQNLLLVHAHWCTGDTEIPEQSMQTTERLYIWAPACTDVNKTGKTQSSCPKVTRSWCFNNTTCTDYEIFPRKVGRLGPPQLPYFWRPCWGSYTQVWGMFHLMWCTPFLAFGIGLTHIYTYGNLHRGIEPLKLRYMYYLHCIHKLYKTVERENIISSVSISIECTYILHAYTFTFFLSEWVFLKLTHDGYH